MRSPAPVAAGDLALHRGFDSAGHVVAETGVSGDTVTIMPHLTWDGKWYWYAAKLTGCRGKTPTIEIPKANRHDNTSGDTAWGWWSYALDSDQWVQFDNLAVGASIASLSNNSPFEHNTVYVMHGPGYPWKRTLRKVSEWSTHPHCEAYQVGTVSARTGFMGSIPSMPMLALIVTDPGAVGLKNQLVWTCGNHSHETPQEWVLEGLIEWLLGESAEALLIRQTCEIYCYPQVNPQGRYGGYFRSSPQDSSKDHNREWQAEPTLQSITLCRNSIAGLTGGVIHMHMDFHSKPQSGDAGYNGHELYGKQSSLGSSAYITAVQVYATLTPVYPDPTVGTVRSYVDALAESTDVINITVEASMGRTKTLTDYVSLGEALGKGLADVIAAGGVLPYGLE